MRKRFPPRLAVLALCLAAPVFGVRADEPAPLRIAVYSGEGASKSVQNVLKVLEELPHLEAEKVLVDDITAGRLASNLVYDLCPASNIHGRPARGDDRRAGVDGHCGQQKQQTSSDEEPMPGSRRA